MSSDSGYGYSLAAEPQTTAATLISGDEEFAHLRRAVIVCVWSEPELWLRGEKAYAFVGPVHVQGAHAKLLMYLLETFLAPALDGEAAEFLILFDHASWNGLNPEEREWLVFHELSHIQQVTDEFDAPKLTKDGRPVLAVRSHDYEFFDREVRKYGPIVCRLGGAAIAIADGHREAQARDQRLRRRAS